MKILHNSQTLKTMSLLMVLSITLCINAFNYTVSFTGRGGSVENILVRNITKGTSQTLTAGQVLNFTDVLSSTNNSKASNGGEIVCFNDNQGNSFVSFSVKHSGNTMINAYGLDGKKIVGITSNLIEGDYTYKMSLPNGVALIQVIGNGFYYNAKLFNPSDGMNAVQIVSERIEMRQQSLVSRVKQSSVLMEYSQGDRIIFRGESGNMSTIVSDVITADKTIDFNFVHCTDANGNHYSTITIGNQVWMAENLKATKYADGTDIILRASTSEYEADPNRSTTPICRYFWDNPATKDIGGLAYKYQTIKHKELCPIGWRVPDHFEWRTLRDNISLNEAERINSIRKTEGGFWDIEGATNASGFSAIATGGFWDVPTINQGKWALWLASDLFNNDPSNCWFFYVGKHAAASNPAIVCEELASSAYDMFGAIRCVRDLEDPVDPVDPNDSAFNYSVSFTGTGGTVGSVLVQNTTKGTSKTISAGQVLNLLNTTADINEDNEMLYAIGDRIVFRGESGNMSTIVSDIITANKTVNFNFYPCEDANGNFYSTITIGTQVWMAENLKTTKYADGTDIILRASQAEYNADPNKTKTPICRYFHDNPATKEIGGLAYKYQTIKHKDISPVGWHVPSSTEWIVLKNNISTNETERINSIRKVGIGGFWDIAGANNASGFSAIATGGFWGEWAINAGQWAIWLASDLWNNDPNNCWYFYVGKHSNNAVNANVCEELPSDAFEMVGAVRCVRND